MSDRIGLFEDYEPLEERELPPEPLHTGEDLNATLANRLMADWLRQREEIRMRKTLEATLRCQRDDFKEALELILYASDKSPAAKMRGIARQALKQITSTMTGAGDE